MLRPQSRALQLLTTDGGVLPLDATVPLVGGRVRLAAQQAQLRAWLAATG